MAVLENQGELGGKLLEIQGENAVAGKLLYSLRQGERETDEIDSKVKLNIQIGDLGQI